MNPQAPPPKPPGSNNPQPQTPQVVYSTRPMQPHTPVIGPEVKRRHEESRLRYPELHLSEGEYVISDVRRHIVGLLAIWTVAVIVVVLAIIVWPIFALNQGNIADTFGINESVLPSGLLVGIPLIILIALFIVGAVIATIVYRDNRFYLTNESVIQHIRTSLFSKKEQTVSLLNIEDASYLQHGILPTLLNYGSLRLSTQGDETTYRFQYVANPKQQVMRLNDAVEAFKNGRPVEGF